MFEYRTNAKSTYREFTVVLAGTGVTVWESDVFFASDDNEAMELGKARFAHHLKRLFSVDLDNYVGDE